MSSLSLESHAQHRDLHSFPTRRSSDLGDSTAAAENPDEDPYAKRRRGGRAVPDSAVPPSADGTPAAPQWQDPSTASGREDRKSTRLNSSHMSISYAVFCLKKKTISEIT